MSVGLSINADKMKELFDLKSNRESLFKSYSSLRFAAVCSIRTCDMLGSKQNEDES